MSDLINSPAHYTHGSMEAKEVIKVVLKEGYRHWLMGSHLKYILRHEHKGNPIQDLEKAEWFLKEYISEMRGTSDEDC